MANDNNNINELVADDDDPTVELESPGFAISEDSLLEADAQTFDSNNDSETISLAGVTVSELESDLRSRQKTIGKLQYDIEQLHAKWLGLETEIGAREAQTGQLHDDLAAAIEAVARKDKLIKKRDRKISSLRAEIRSRNEEYNHLKNRLDQLQDQVDDNTPAALDQDSSALQPHPAQNATALLNRVSRSERYADTLRQKSQDLIEANEEFDREVSALRLQLNEMTEAKNGLGKELSAAKLTIDELQTQLSNIEAHHESEIRILRFELGDAQDTVVETESLNSQLASELVDAQGFKQELERMLGELEESSSHTIKKLEKEANKAKRTAEDYEQKLHTKSEAISVLLAELAKKTEQAESIDEIEDVIQEIDERMSERSEKNAQQDRVSRVLIGTVDDQVLRFPLFKDRLTVGRTKDNDIQLKAAYVSRRHAVIQTDGDATRIIDWGSKNGIHINSNKVSEHFLSHGDVVTIGNARFRYEERRMRDS